MGTHFSIPPLPSGSGEDSRLLRVLRPPRWRDWSRRAVFAACFLLDSLFLVVWERSLASFKCTSVDGGGVRLRYLTAAPYVDCDGPELVRVRVLAGFALAAFGLGLPLALAVAAWRRRALCSGGSNAASTRIASPRLTRGASRVPAATGTTRVLSTSRCSTPGWRPVRIERAGTSSVAHAPSAGRKATRRCRSASAREAPHHGTRGRI